MLWHAGSGARGRSIPTEGLLPRLDRVIHTLLRRNWQLILKYAKFVFLSLLRLAAGDVLVELQVLLKHAVC